MPPIFSTCGMEVLKDDNQDKTPLGLGSVAGHHGGIIVWEQLSPGLPQTEKEPRAALPAPTGSCLQPLHTAKLQE